MPIGNDLFKLAHGRIGILRVRPLTFRQTLAAALLGEVMLEGLATIDDGHVKPLPAPRAQPVLAPGGQVQPGRSPVCGNPLVSFVYAAMTADNQVEPRTLETWRNLTLVRKTEPRTVRTWLDYIAIWSYQAVSLRLQAVGEVNQVPYLFRRGTYHEPTDPQYDAAGIRIAHNLGSKWWADTPTVDVVLAALLSIAGLLDEVLVYPEKAPECRHRLAQLMSNLPPAYTTLIREAKAALDGKVLAAR